MNALRASARVFRRIFRSCLGAEGGGVRRGSTGAVRALAGARLTLAGRTGCTWGISSSVCWYSMSGNISSNTSCGEAFAGFFLLLALCPTTAITIAPTNISICMISSIRLYINRYIGTKLGINFLFMQQKGTKKGRELHSCLPPTFLT